jgi:hypothetical protein
MSEIPLDHLDRLSRHGDYGFGFLKAKVRAAGGAPVWYLWRDSPRADDFYEVVRTKLVGGVDPTDAVWKITPFIEYPGSGDWGRYEFDWEREWRVPSDFHFAWEDVKFLVVPCDPPADGASNSGNSVPGTPALPVFALDWPMEVLQRHLALERL